MKIENTNDTEAEIIKKLKEHSGQLKGYVLGNSSLTPGIATPSNPNLTTQYTPHNIVKDFEEWQKHQQLVQDDHRIKMVDPVLEFLYDCSKQLHMEIDLLERLIAKRTNEKNI